MLLMQRWIQKWNCGDSRQTQLGVQISLYSFFCSWGCQPVEKYTPGLGPQTVGSIMSIIWNAPFESGSLEEVVSHFYIIGKDTEKLKKHWCTRSMIQAQPSSTLISHWTLELTMHVRDSNPGTGRMVWEVVEGHEQFWFFCHRRLYNFF